MAAKEFLHSMIPHHPGAILMCEQATITDQRLMRYAEKFWNRKAPRSPNASSPPMLLVSVCAILALRCAREAEYLQTRKILIRGPSLLGLVANYKHVDVCRSHGGAGCVLAEIRNHQLSRVTFDQPFLLLTRPSAALSPRASFCASSFAQMCMK